MRCPCWRCMLTLTSGRLRQAHTLLFRNTALSACFFACEITDSSPHHRCPPLLPRSLLRPPHQQSVRALQRLMSRDLRQHLGIYLLALSKQGTRLLHLSLSLHETSLAATWYGEAATSGVGLGRLPHNACQRLITNVGSTVHVCLLKTYSPPMFPLICV